MKNIKPRLISLLHKGCCTPQILQLAKKLKEPSSTIHYNIKKLEQDHSIIAYKAVFDYRKIDQGFLAIALLTLTLEGDDDPEIVAREIAKRPEVESCDICTGDWELVVRVRTKDQNEYYNFTKSILRMPGVRKLTTLASLKQLKTEFVELP